MKYHIHIPKLLEFALNVVCDDVTLRGKNCLSTPIPYPLYLRCIMTYADKYGKDRYSIYRFYRDIRRKVDVDAQIGRLYANVLDHVVLDDDDVNAKLITEVSQSHLVDDAFASIQRFASRCLAADKSEMIVAALSQVLMEISARPRPIIDLLIFYGAKLDPEHEYYFNRACVCGASEIVRLCIERRRQDIYTRDTMAAIECGDCETIRLVFGAYRGRYDLDWQSLKYANVESLELLMSLNVIQRATHYLFSNIPSFSVLQWILDHDVMKHDAVLIDIASNAVYYSGHYFDMLRYLIEQRNFTVPRDILIRIALKHTTDLDVLDYLVWHGADVNAVDDYGRNVLECSPMLVRYWIDKGLSVNSSGAIILVVSIAQGMTASVLMMMIDIYSFNINAVDRDGDSALHEACRKDRFEVVRMLIHHGANQRQSNNRGKTPYQVSRSDRVRQLFDEHDCEPNLCPINLEDALFSV